VAHRGWGESCVIGVAAAGLPSDYPSIPMRGVAGNVPMPLVGVGTWQYDDATAGTAVVEGFKVGMRHVDTALGYRNQNGVGAALKTVGLDREEYFVTSKIPGGTDFNETTANLELALQQLDLKYVDLMLLHYPATWGGQGGPETRKAQWQALEKWAKAGKARAIGISHYCQSHVEDVLSVSTLPIALNQVMYHVGMGQSPDVATDYKDYMKSQGIVYMSFSTLCGPCGDEKMELINGPLVTEIAQHYNVTGPQVALKWAVQQGVPVVPKSSNPVHLAQDFDLFSFNLTDADMTKLTAAKTPSTGADMSGDCDVASLLV